MKLKLCVIYLYCSATPRKPLLYINVKEKHSYSYPPNTDKLG